MADQPNDGDLLRAFVESKDHALFGQLVDRHQALVLSACRNQLLNEHDAEDAAQRVFLTLVRKARGLCRRPSLAGWLYQTAQHTALTLRRSNRRRLRREALVSTRGEHDDSDQRQQQEWREVFDHQLADLPAKYREPIVLHHLQGMPQQQAAQRMGMDKGAFAMRLARGRKMLADRLHRSGLTLSSAGLASLALAEDASAQLAAEPAFFQQAVQELENHSTMVSRMKIAAVFLLLMLGVAGTTYALTNPAPNDRPTNNSASKKPPVPVKATEIQKQAQGNMRFALELYQQLKTTNDNSNIVCSPYSVSTCFGMAYAGAKAKTAKEMQTVMHYDSKTDHLPDVLQKTSRTMLEQARRDKIKFDIANALVLTKGELNEDYKQLIVNRFAGEVIAGTEPLKLINQWVEKKTKGNIKEILTYLDPQSVGVLLNAVYFKADWKSPFSPKATRDQPFFPSMTKKVSAPLMRKDSLFLHLKQEDLQVLQLPYIGDQFSMVIFLPSKRDGLADFEKTLSPKTLTAWFDKLDQAKPGRVQVEFPTFSLSTKIDLKPLAIQMGIRDAFDSQRADFGGMEVDPSQGLFLSQAVHKGFINVAEKGTEAGGATAIEIVSQSKPPTFRADHPFWFVIRHHGTNSILFMGRVIDPTQK